MFSVVCRPLPSNVVVVAASFFSSLFFIFIWIRLMVLLLHLWCVCVFFLLLCRFVFVCRATCFQFYFIRKVKSLLIHSQLKTSQFAICSCRQTKLINWYICGGYGLRLHVPGIFDYLIISIGGEDDVSLFFIFVSFRFVSFCWCVVFGFVFVSKTSNADVYCGTTDPKWIADFMLWFPVQ